MSSSQMELTTDLELILLGTGTSGQLPNVSCLTQHLDPDAALADIKKCRTCCSTVEDVEGEAEGWKNRRRNTSAVVRGRRADGSQSTILVDCGKSFLSSALAFWPKHNLRKIDACLLTHAHADAINGLDDLRGWTLRGVVQDSVKIYCSKTTLDEIARASPYMVEKSKATGGGDVPAFEWIVIEEDKDFIVEGIRVTPLNVHHGRYFDAPGDGAATPIVRPYYCLGFMFNPSIVYLSDVSYIPQEVWSKLIAHHPQSLPSMIPTTTTDNPPTSPAVLPPSPPDTPLDLAAANSGEHLRIPLLVLDTLHLHPHTSHFGLLQALYTILRLRPLRTYLIGFSHLHSHAEWTAFGEELDGTREGEREEAFVETAMRIVGELGVVAKKEEVFVRPGWDGLHLGCEGIKRVRELNVGGKPTRLDVLLD